MNLNIFMLIMFYLMYVILVFMKNNQHSFIILYYLLIQLFMFVHNVVFIKIIIFLIQQKHNRSHNVLLPI